MHGSKFIGWRMALYFRLSIPSMNHLRPSKFHHDTRYAMFVIVK